MFPAYAASSSLSDNEQGTTSAAWLCNSSFVPVEIKPNTLQCSDSSCTSSDKTDREPTFKHKKKKRDKRRRKDNSDHKLKSSDMFYEDRSGDKGLLASKFQKSSKVGKANERGMAREKMVNSENLKPKKKKRKKTKRYFSKIIQGVEENETGETVRAPVDVQNFFKCTEEFNKKLRDEPQNEKLWVEYIQLQDKGEGSIQGIAEKKLAIIEKALAENPLSSILLNEKFAVSEKIFPLDKVASDAKALVIRDPRNIIGWNWLLKCNQFNLSRMTVPNVLTTYSSILQGLHSSHREYGAMLDVLLQCGLFLRQAGLWEQLWLLLQMYLDLNLTDPGSNVFKCKLTLPEDKIRELEDSIVTCGLPLGAIWLRIEHLREATNFLPIESGEDPQRIVFVDDVSHLLFPINRAEVPRLIAIIFVLLKVPPLPMLDSFLEFVGLKKINWAIESSELLLTATYDYGIVQMDIGYIGPAKELIVPPQYINEKLGEYEFFQFVNLVFENCEKYFGDKVPLLIWQMRWWRFIMKLQGKDSKNFHSKAKKLLKKYREDIPLYVEYALLEMDIGDFDATVKVLETAIALRESPLNVVNERGNICYLYKTFIEVLLKRDFTKYRVKALGILIGLALGKTTKDVIVTDQSIAKADERFGHLTTEILREVDIHGELTLSDLMLPNFSVSWLACHAWFIYLTKNVWESGTLIEKAIKDLKDSIGSSSQILGKCVLEHYFMIQTSLFHHYCHNNPGHFSTLHNILRSALLSFPENIYLLSVGASTGLNENNWWKSQSDCDSVLGNIFKIFTTREKMKNEECNSGAVNTQRMSNLLKQFSIHPILKACPLIWRLYLQFVNSESAAGIKKIFYQAVENCPWVKPIYYGAAQILPEELSQIQDLLVEKELRLHITPEEIEILRETDS